MSDLSRRMSEASDAYVAAIVAEQRRNAAPTQRAVAAALGKSNITARLGPSAFSNPEDIEQEGACLPPDPGDEALPMTLWLLKYSQAPYVLKHSIMSFFPVQYLDSGGPRQRETMVRNLASRLQDHVWGKRSIISTSALWSVRHLYSSNKPRQWWESYDMARALAERVSDDRVEIVLEVSMISMPMRPTLLW